MDTQIGEANAVLREFYGSVDKTRAFKHRKAVSFYIGLYSDPYLWLWSGILGYDEKILTQVQAPKMGFLRRVHGVTKGRTEVRLRPGQETNLAPSYLNLR